MNDRTDPVAWLLDEEDSDPAIRWQVRSDVLHESGGMWRDERSRVAEEGWGRRLLDLRDEDGQWDGGSFFPADFTRAEYERDGQPWTATTWALHELYEFGVDPEHPRIVETIDLVDRNARWDHEGQPYWDGEVEPCINGRTVAHGAYFRADVDDIVHRLLEERLEDGGWNCEAERGATVSSFDTTINVVEGLLEYERAHGSDIHVRRARLGGEEYLLDRGLFRGLRSGEPIEEFLVLSHPHRWHHDLLRGLDHFRAASLATDGTRDPRLADAIARLRDRRAADGTWHLEHEHRGRRWFGLDDGAGRPSRWLTLKALRVLDWWDAGHPADA